MKNRLPLMLATSGPGLNESPLLLRFRLFVIVLPSPTDLPPMFKSLAADDQLVRGLHKLIEFRLRECLDDKKTGRRLRIPGQ